MRKNRYPTFLLFVAPGLLVYGLFCLYPTLAGVVASFWDWDGYTQARRFVGLANFQELGRDPVFWRALRNNLFLVAGPGLLLFGLALYLANSLNDSRRPGRRLFQFAYLFPNILAGTVVASLWSFVYNPSFGVVKRLLSGGQALLEGAGLGGAARLLSLPELAGRAWLAPEFFLTSLVPMLVWAGAGFYTVLFLAGLQNIPRDLFEAARIDGASEWQVFRYITWPGLGPVRLAAVTFLLISGMKIFDTVWVMTQGMVPDRNHVLGTYVYQMAFIEARLSYGTAVAVVLMLIILAFVWLNHRLTKEQR